MAEYVKFLHVSLRRKKNLFCAHRSANVHNEPECISVDVH